MLFSTAVTPGAFQAARPASSCSRHERTLPDNFTLPPSADTAMCSASTSASRFNAFSISSLTSLGRTVGLMVMSLETPRTPGRYARRSEPRSSGTPNSPGLGG